MAKRVPELSLKAFTAGSAAERAGFSRDLFRALKNYGFIVLKDHDAPLQLLDSAYDMAARVFALPEADKRRYAFGMRGYTPFGTEHAKDSDRPDLKEFWQIGREIAPGVTPDEPFPPNVWPEEVPGFRETFLALFEALDRTGAQVLRALAAPLDLPEDHFDLLTAQGTSILRVLHYPPVGPDAPEGAVRSAAHEDINFITLMPAARGAGLELLDRDGEWLPVEADPMTLIVDSGDMMQRLTNGVIPATTHRVVNPKGPNVSRYSMPFFMHPSSATSLACLPSCRGAGERWPPITAGAFLEERLREIGLKG